MERLKEVAFVFLKLGIIAFGGPAAHIGMFEEEVVSKRKWMSRQHFLDLMGATNLIPGPNSTEMTIHCGYHRAGIPGLIVGGISFIFPSVIITGFLAYLYVAYGTLPQVEPFLYGIKPAVIVIILNAVYKLGLKAIKGWKLLLIALVVVAINFLGVNEIFSILFGGLFGAFFIYLSEKKNTLNSVSIFFFSIISSIPILQEVEKSDLSITKLFFVFLKIGAVLFGSGYVLVAYLDGEIVQGLQWLSRKELLDAIAIGQFTPGPVLSTATFIGYQLAGIGGAIVATIGIFLPSFLFVFIVNPIVPRLRKSKVMSKFLDAVNVSALAVMFVVGIKLGVEVLIDWKSLLIALISAIAFITIKKINSAYVILGGALLGYILFLI